jgi:hypothetical protein
MAWEELLRRQDAREETARDAGTETAPDGAGLLRQVRALFGQSAAEEPPAAEETAQEQEPPGCADGYVRRAPVQPYQTAPDFTRRRVRKIVTAVVVLVLAAVLVLTLVRVGMLQFRLR